MSFDSLINQEGELRKVAVRRAILAQLEALSDGDYFHVLSACQEVEIITRVLAKEQEREAERKARHNALPIQLQ